MIRSDMRELTIASSHESDVPCSYGSDLIHEDVTSVVSQSIGYIRMTERSSYDDGLTGAVTMIITPEDGDRALIHMEDENDDEYQCEMTVPRSILCSLAHTILDRFETPHEENV